MVKSFDTVDRGVLYRVLSGLGLPASFRHVFACGLGEPRTRDGGILHGAPYDVHCCSVCGVCICMPWGGVVRKQVFAGASLDANTPSPSSFSVNSSDHFGKSRSRFPDAGTLVLSLRVVAGLGEESSDVPCGNNVEDVLALELEEPADNPGTEIGTVLRAALGYSAIWGRGF